MGIQAESSVSIRLWQHNSRFCLLGIDLSASVPSHLHIRILDREHGILSVHHINLIKEYLQNSLLQNMATSWCPKSLWILEKSKLVTHQLALHIAYHLNDFMMHIARVDMNSLTLAQKNTILCLLLTVLKSLRPSQNFDIVLTFSKLIAHIFK